MKKIQLSNENFIPALGLGTWKSKPGEVYNAVRKAIQIGYRHIDCASVYANEKEIGEALSDAFNAGDVKRKEMWITSKLWNNAHETEEVVPALQQTLKDLQLDYIDLYLIHWPVAFNKAVMFPKEISDYFSSEELPITATWKGMESTIVEGLSKHIGVSNFSTKKLQDLIDNSSILPEINQIELHPFLQQSEMLDFCQKNNISLTAYAPLGSKDRDPSRKGENEPSLLEHPLINDLANQKQCSPAQILIAWALERGTIVIPKSVNPERLQQNFEAISINLSQDEMNSIAALDKNFRYVDGTFWTTEGSPYTLENLWD